MEVRPVLGISYLNSVNEQLAPKVWVELGWFRLGKVRVGKVRLGLVRIVYIVLKG